MGASGTGKTTLARLVADELDISFQPSSISASARKHGFNSVGLMTLKDRVRLQRHLLDDYLEMLDAAPRPIITDRTPLDMIGYMMAEFHMLSHHAVDPALLTEAELYVSECLRETRKWFDHIFHLSRLDLYEIKNTRPPENPAYQRHTDLIMKGCLIDLGINVSYTIVAGQSLDFRHGLVTETIVRRLDAMDLHRRSTKNIN
jgi:hypothetical protein